MKFSHNLWVLVNFSKMKVTSWKGESAQIDSCFEQSRSELGDEQSRAVPEREPKEPKILFLLPGFELLSTKS